MPISCIVGLEIDVHAADLVDDDGVAAIARIDLTTPRSCRPSTTSTSWPPPPGELVATSTAIDDIVAARACDRITAIATDHDLEIVIGHVGWSPLRYRHDHRILTIATDHDTTVEIRLSTMTIVASTGAQRVRTFAAGKCRPELIRSAYRLPPWPLQINTFAGRRAIERIGKITADSCLMIPAEPRLRLSWASVPGRDGDIVASTTRECVGSVCEDRGVAISAGDIICRHHPKASHLPNHRSGYRRRHRHREVPTCRQVAQALSVSLPSAPDRADNLFGRLLMLVAP